MLSLSLVIEYIGFPPSGGIPIRTPPLVYKHLQPFINLFAFSPIDDVMDLSYSLAWAAMFSTGAFDRNLDEVWAWLLFYQGKENNLKVLQLELC